MATSSCRGIYDVYLAHLSHFAEWSIFTLNLANVLHISVDLVFQLLEITARDAVVQVKYSIDTFNTFAEM